MKLRSNQSGIAHFAAISLVVVVVVIGFVGWKVWDNKHSKSSNSSANDSSTKKTSELTTTNSADAKKTIDETADWLTFTSSKGWNVKVPDGWKLITNNSSDGLTAYSALTYKAGTKATVEKSGSGRGGPFVLNTANNAAGDPATANPDYLTTEAVFNGKNVEGRKYSGVLKEDVPMEGSKGDTIYRYVFVKNSKSVIFMHQQPKDSASIIAELEKSLATLEIN